MNMTVNNQGKLIFQVHFQNFIFFFNDRCRALSWNRLFELKFKVIFTRLLLPSECDLAVTEDWGPLLCIHITVASAILSKATQPRLTEIAARFSILL